MKDHAFFHFFRNFHPHSHAERLRLAENAHAIQIQPGVAVELNTRPATRFHKFFFLLIAVGQRGVGQLLGIDFIF